jgi:uncharacterized protein (TIGR03437 family)
MRFAPFLFAAQLFAAAGGGTIVIDSPGNVWQSGSSGTLVTTSDAFQKTATAQVCGTQDLSPFQGPTTISCTHGYLTKKDASGNVLYSTYIGGTSQDGVTAMTVDAQGNVYLAGYTYSSDFPVTAGAVQSKNAGPTQTFVFTALGAPYGPSYVVPGGDVFVAKFTSTGTLVFSTLLGGSKSDIPTLIAVDSTGNVYVAGATESGDFPLVNGMAGPVSNTFFTKLNSGGSALTFSTYFSAPIYAFDVDRQGIAYITGSANGIPYVDIVDTSAGRLMFSTTLNTLKTTVAGAGVAIALNSAGNLMLAVSPAPPLYNFFVYPNLPGRARGNNYLFTLRSDAGAILAETDLAQAELDSIVLDSAGNAYTFGNGTGPIPNTPIQLLSGACSSLVASFVLETNSAGAVVTATYLRQGTDAAVAITSPNHLLVYRALSNSTVAVDLSVQPEALFGCPANLASGIANAGLAPGEIFLLTGTGLGPAQSIGAVPNAAGQYPTSLGGVQLLIGSTALPLLYVQANEIHAVAPFSLPNVFPLQVQFGNQTVAPLDAPYTYLNPGVFSINGQGAIVNQDGTVNTPANPAVLGSYVSLYGTGLGQLTTPVIDGGLAPIPPPYDPTTLVAANVIFAGVSQGSSWLGAAPGLVEGVTQINVKLPATLPGGTNLAAVPVIVNAVGLDSPPVSISVKQ